MRMLVIDVQCILTFLFLETFYVYWEKLRLRTYGPENVKVISSWQAFKPG